MREVGLAVTLPVCCWPPSTFDSIDGCMSRRICQYEVGLRGNQDGDAGCFDCNTDNRKIWLLARVCAKPPGRSVNNVPPKEPQAFSTLHGTANGWIHDRPDTAA
ncbi:hypothetical protein FALCPG4_19061 [Fusarium falciforme]